MEESALLAEFLALADNMPDFASFTPTSRIHHEWLAKIQALVRQWDPSEVPPLRAEIDFIGYSVVRDKTTTKIVSVLYRAIADLQFRLHAAPAKSLDRGLFMIS